VGVADLVPPATFRIDPDVQLMTELTKDDALDSPTTKLEIVEVGRVNYRHSPTRSWPTRRIPSISKVAQAVAVNLERPDDESVSDLAMNANNCLWYEVGIFAPAVD
jgi:hypothetical protein